MSHDLGRNKFTAHLGNEAPLALVRKGAEQADQLAVRGAHSSDVVPLVVSVGAREALASRHGSGAVNGEDLLDPVGVGRVHNGGYIEVGSSCVAVEAELPEHARDIVSSFGDGVEIPDPAGWEGLIGGLVTWDDKGVQGFEAGLGGEIDGSLGAVLVDEVD